MVPYENLRHKQRPESANHNNWMQVSGEDRAEAWYPRWMWKTDPQDRAENQNRTNLIPCCGLIGYPAYMAVDEALDTYWDSGVTETANLSLSVVSDIQSLKSIDILWTTDYAIQYRVLISNDASLWKQVAHYEFGDGGMDRLTLLPQECHLEELKNFQVCLPGEISCECKRPCDEPKDCRGHGQCRVSGDCLCNARWTDVSCDISGMSSAQKLHIRIEILSPAWGSIRYGIKEVSVRGCSNPTLSVSTSVTLKAEDGENIFTARLSLMPKVISVVPTRGSTAGGTGPTLRFLQIIFCCKEAPCRLEQRRNPLLSRYRSRSMTTLNPWSFLLLGARSLHVTSVRWSFMGSPRWRGRSLQLLPCLTIPRSCCRRQWRGPSTAKL